MDRNPDDTWTSDALERGDISAVMERVRTDPSYLSSRDFVGDTPLLTAIGFNAAGLVAFLLEHGADPDPEVDDGYTSLLSAIESEAAASLEIVAKLIDAGADIQRAGTNGWTPLHMAAARGHVEKARLLIDAGADVNRRKEIDAEETPLMEAAEQGRAEAVRLLLERGADPNLRDTIHERTPLEAAQHASNGPDPRVMEFLQSPDQRRMHAEIQSQVTEHILQNSNLSPEQREIMRAHLDSVDPVEEYRKATEERTHNGDFEEVIRLLSCKSWGR